MRGSKTPPYPFFEKGVILFMTLSREDEFGGLEEGLHKCEECGEVVDETSADAEYWKGRWFCDKHCKEFYQEYERYL